MQLTPGSKRWPLLADWPKKRRDAETRHAEARRFEKWLEMLGNSWRDRDPEQATKRSRKKAKKKR